MVKGRAVYSSSLGEVERLGYVCASLSGYPCSILIHSGGRPSVDLNLDGHFADRYSTVWTHTAKLLARSS